MENTNYSVKIRTSSRELTARERIRFKDTSAAVSLDDATNGGSIIITNPAAYVILDVHNEKADTPDYVKFVVIDEAGNSYITGSDSFYRSFLEIFEEMQGEGEYSIEVSKHDSKNYKGKGFIKAAIV